MSNSLEIQNTVYIDTNQNFDSKVFEAKLKNLFDEKQNLEELVDSLASKLKTFLHKRLRFKTEVELFEENVQKAAVDKIELNFNSNVTKNLQTGSFEVISFNQKQNLKIFCRLISLNLFSLV